MSSIKLGRLKFGFRRALIKWVLGGVLYLSIFHAVLLFAEDPPTGGAALIKEIRFATLQDIYPHVNQQDARMALELLMQKTIAQKSYPYKVKLHFIDSTAPVVDTVRRGGYHFVTLSGIDYLQYRNALHLKPILIPTKSDRAAEPLLFLTQKGQTLSAIAQKKERVLIIGSGRSGDLSKMWADYLLYKQGFSDSGQFFTNIRRVQKPLRAVLPVFFNQADACIVTQETLRVLDDLNPQIGRRVKVLYQSEGVVRMVLCATEKPDSRDIEALVKESINLEKNADTRQAMTIIQMKRFFQARTEDLAFTKKLVLGKNPNFVK